MLVLSRKVGQQIVIDERVTITITRIAGGRVSVGIEAPPGVHVRRSELAPLPPVNEARPPHDAKPGVMFPTGIAAPLTDAGASLMSGPNCNC